MNHFINFDPYTIGSTIDRCTRRATPCVSNCDYERTAKPSRLVASIKRGRIRTTSSHGFVQASLANGGVTLWTLR
jgi:hypothetical protein